MEKMDKTQWQSLYGKLDQICSDFNISYRVSQNGKNKKIRMEADRKVNDAITLAYTLIRNNSEAYELLTGKVSNGYGRAIIIDEFKLPQYFGFDMSMFLEKVKHKISDFE